MWQALGAVLTRRPILCGRHGGLCLLVSPCWVAGMRGREEREKFYSGINEPDNGAGPADGDDFGAEEELADLGFTDDQQAQVRDNAGIVQQRENEITSIVTVCFLPKLCIWWFAVAST